MVAYANKGNQYDQYKRQNVMMASPGELTLMLYDGCIKNMKLAKMYLDEKKLERAHEVLIKAQNILVELIQSLDMSYDISHQLLQIYDFLYNSLVEINVKKNGAKLDALVELVTDLRDTWQQAVRMNRQSEYGNE